MLAIAQLYLLFSVIKGFKLLCIKPYLQWSIHTMASASNALGEDAYLPRDISA